MKPVQAHERHLRHMHGIEVLTAQHKALRRLKREQEQPSIHGNKLWGSSFVLMDYFERHPLTPGSRVLELGCGWGLNGIHLARRQQAKVTAADADPAVFPFLRLFAEHNGVALETRTARFERITAAQLAEFDVVIGADICFWDELAETVYRLIGRAVRAGVGKIVIADPQRPPFTAMAERCVEDFYGEIVPWSTNEPRRFTGSVLVIENA